MSIAIISLGSNEGDRVLWMNKAMTLIESFCGSISRKSSVYETAAWGINTQPDFLNMVVAVATELAPEVLLATLLGIETTLGRHRTVKWGPRIIDLDILFYDDVVIHSSDLTIPHPFLQERRFTLIPLVEIAPAYMHPILHKTTTELLEICPDPLDVHVFKS